MEQVVLVDEAGRVLGTEEKLAAHRGRGRLHLAFSVFLFDRRGRTLLQLRSRNKHHFGGLWSNTCCSHPRPGEDVVTAGARRLQEEMGFSTSVTAVGTFVYRAHDPVSGLIEHELDHVLTGVFHGDPTPNAEEVDDWRWVGLEEVVDGVTRHPGRYTPWLPDALAVLTRAG